MNKYLIEYGIKYHNRFHVVIEAPTPTQAYILFMIKFPKEYEIVEIKEISPVEA